MLIEVLSDGEIFFTSKDGALRAWVVVTGAVVEVEVPSAVRAKDEDDVTRLIVVAK